VPVNLEATVAEPVKLLAGAGAPGVGRRCAALPAIARPAGRL